MSYYKKTPVWKKILFSPGMALVIIFLIIFIGYGVVSVVDKSIDASRNRKRSEAEAQTLAQKEIVLSAKLEALKSPEGQEAALREQFPVVRPGEGVVVIVEESKRNTTTVEPEQSKGGFWKFLKDLFTL